MIRRKADATVRVCKRLLERPRNKQSVLDGAIVTRLDHSRTDSMRTGSQSVHCAYLGA